MRGGSFTFLPLLLAPCALLAQQGTVTILPAEQQIAGAVAPLPPELREDAIVLGYRPLGRGLVTLREGSGEMICLADDPFEAERFHAACYHRSLEPFMARGRELRAQGVIDRAIIDSVRQAEAESGALPMPEHPAALYSLTGPAGAFDAATGEVTGATPLFVLYMPWATAEVTGLSARPKRGEPWIMFPGKPWAHIMLVPPAADTLQSGER
jgi:hypothetical protein